MADIFRLALSLAKYGNKKVCDDFLEKYCIWISKENKITQEEALKIAQSNLGYYAGYYNRETYTLMNEFYGAVHPVFKKNPFDMSKEEILAHKEEKFLKWHEDMENGFPVHF
jgi:hypothetical protein